ncbi:MAG: polysaccharide deacetylase family protein [Firmicutes bacterium]|nr:polysaccharide deacetylase family protein [Bacillota bacterium]
MSDLPEVAHLMRLAVLGISASVIYIYIRRFTGRVAARLLDWTPTSRRERLLMTIIATLLTIVAVFLAVHFYVYSGLDYQPDIYRTGNPKTNQVALTFDDGPSQEFTPFVLDVLREYNAPATFFLVGVHVERCPDIARRIAEEGHEIGNHTYRHVTMPTASNKTLYEEVIKATRVITQVTGEYPKYIRPPRGVYDARFRRLSHVLGQKIVLWTISTRDWRYGTSTQAIVKRAVSQAKGGDIILFHDSGALIRNEGGDRSATVRALPLVIEGLRQKGLEIVPLGELLEEEFGEEFPVVEIPE